MKGWLSSYIRVPYPFRRAPFSPSTLIWSKIFDFCKRPHDRCDQLCWCRRQSLTNIAMKVDFQDRSPCLLGTTLMMKIPLPLAPTPDALTPIFRLGLEYQAISHGSQIAKLNKLRNRTGIVRTRAIRTY